MAYESIHSAWLMHLFDLLIAVWFGFALVTHENRTKPLILFWITTNYTLTDLSESKSTESLHSNGFPGIFDLCLEQIFGQIFSVTGIKETCVFIFQDKCQLQLCEGNLFNQQLSLFSDLHSKDLDSHEVLVPQTGAKEQASLRKTVGVDGDVTQWMDLTSRLVQDHKSKKQSRIQGELHASGGQTDQNGEEGMTLKPASASQSTNLQRQAKPGMTDRMAPYRSRETLNRDSLEDKNSRLAAVGSSKNADYDGMTEFYRTLDSTHYIPGITV